MSLLLLFRRVVSGVFAPGRRQVAARGTGRTVVGVSAGRVATVRPGRQWAVRA